MRWVLWTLLKINRKPTSYITRKWMRRELGDENNHVRTVFKLWPRENWLAGAFRMKPGLTQNSYTIKQTLRTVFNNLSSLSKVWLYTPQTDTCDPLILYQYKPQGNWLGKLTQSVSLVVYTDIWNKKSHPLKMIPWLPLPRLYRNLGVIPSYTAVNGCMASDWHPEQRYWQNRDTANIGLDSSVGRAPAR